MVRIIETKKDRPLAWTLKEKIVLITGGNTGIGRAAAIELAQRGAEVLFTSRDPEAGERARVEISRAAGHDVTCLPLDLAWFSSIRKLADAVLVGWPALHVLINNAGAVLTRRSETVEGFETTLGVNHVGHFLLTTLLLDRIKNSAPARIINVSSRAHLRAVTGLDFGDLQSRRHYRGFLAYSRSKLANIYFTRELARRLEGTEVTANAVHPGLVATRFAQDRDTRWLGALMRLGTWFMLSPEQGADTVVYCASDPELSASGKYFVHRRESTPSRAAQDDDAARRLWEETERWIREGHP